MDRTIKILKSQIDLMQAKLRENNIDFDEHLDVRFDDKKLHRSNSPTIEGPLSTLTTERITKGIHEEKTRSEYNAFNTTLSGNRSESKFGMHSNSKSYGGQFNEVMHKKKVVKKNTREGSVISSSSSQNITSYRTAPVNKPPMKEISHNKRENELLDQISKLQKEIELYKSQAAKPHFESFDKDNDKNDLIDEYEEPVSFRDKQDDPVDPKLQTSWDSDFDYEHFEDKLKGQKPSVVAKDIPQIYVNKQSRRSTPGSQKATENVKLKRLSIGHDKKAIMKLFDHLDSEISYEKYFALLKTSKSNTIYLEDENKRVWQIKREYNIPPRNLDSLSSVKSLDSPVSLSSEKLQLNTKVVKAERPKKKISTLEIDIEGSDEEEKVEILNTDSEQVRQSTFLYLNKLNTCLKPIYR